MLTMATDFSVTIKYPITDSGLPCGRLNNWTLAVAPESIDIKGSTGQSYKNSLEFCLLKGVPT